VFIDEIQEVEQWESGVKSLFAEGKWDIYLTGSNARLLSGELATYLAGRYIQIFVHPLSYLEFLDFYRSENSPHSLAAYLRIGGMPYLGALWRTYHTEPAAGAPDAEQEKQFETLAREYLVNLYESILLRDVVARDKIRNVQFLENLAMYLADNTGNLFSAANISKYLKNQKLDINVQTVINYLTTLENSLLVSRVRRQEVNGLKLFEIGEKYYFEDIGLRNLLVRNPALDTAKLAEQAVYLYLVQQGWSVSVGKLGDQEIDFIGQKDSRRVYVQVAYRITDEAQYNREFGNLEKIPDQFPKYVVSMDDNLPATNSKGIRWTHLREFLTGGV
jgi:predicted AAA+ superfamily ATPase